MLIAITAYNFASSDSYNNFLMSTTSANSDKQIKVNSSALFYRRKRNLYQVIPAYSIIHNVFASHDAKNFLAFLTFPGMMAKITKCISCQRPLQIQTNVFPSKLSVHEICAMRIIHVPKHQDMTLFSSITHFYICFIQIFDHLN